MPDKSHSCNMCNFGIPPQNIWMNLVMKLLLIASFLLFISEVVFAQNKPAAKDTVNVYRDIQSYSDKKKFTRFIYKLIFKPLPESQAHKKKPIKSKFNSAQKPYSNFEGKIIRSIQIETLDPFGYTIGDTVIVSQNALSRTGNKLHIKSQRITIRNLLLIHENDIFDSLLVKESERLVRAQKYITDVAFFVAMVSKTSDSVDVFIRSLDKWSITPKLLASTSKVTLRLTERNFLGLGHEFKNAYTWFHSTGDDAFNTNYFIPNILNTYITTNVKYGSDEFGYFTKSASVDRTFFSPFTEWAGGINIAQQYLKDSFPGFDSTLAQLKIKYNAQDYWGGWALRLFKGSSEVNRTSNLISTFRFLRIRYIDKPGIEYDPLLKFSNTDFYLAGIGISSRRYLKEKYIFKFGINEDIPIGKVFGLTGGYEVKNNSGKTYLGARVAIGNYYDWGYLSSNFEYATYIRGSKSEQGIASVNIIYFTELLEIGRWKFRQFANPRVTIGINRIKEDSLTINDGFGLDGFNSSTLSGTNRILLSFQTQSYAPWNVLGFKFGPYLRYSIGMLGDANVRFTKSKVYSQIGFGFLIKNESLVFNTFQISISLYPSIPGVGNNVTKVNSFNTKDFGFSDFDLGKPSVIPFE